VEYPTVDDVLATPLDPRSVPQKVLHYDQADRAAWHAGHLLDRVPEREREKTKIRGRTDKYQRQCPRNHYGEVLSMVDLDRDGWHWLYDEYYLFWRVKNAQHVTFAEREAWMMDRRATVYRTGTKELTSVVGRERMDLLLAAGERLRTPTFRLTEPDLFAWKIDGDGRVRFNCIEVKLQSDPIRPDQMMGMALLKRVLGDECEVVVHKYLRRP
jgi:hypothetical protein